MKKDEMNNAIVLLRQSVRKARVCVINKLVREAKKLRNKHGPETQLEKNRKKADRLLKEVSALKMIKDDQVSKFGIINVQNLQTLFQDSSADYKIHVMARVACHKSLNARLIEFKTKYPDYEKYVSSARKKPNVQNKVNGSMGHSLKLSPGQSHKANVRNKRTKDAPMNMDDGSGCVMDVEDTSSNLSDGERPIEAPPFTETKNELTAYQKDGKNFPRIQKMCDKEDTNVNKSSKSVCAISKEATVKRFEELISAEPLVDTETSKESDNDSSLDRPKEFERQTDDFFVCPGKESEYSMRQIQRDPSRVGADELFASSVERKNRWMKKMKEKKETFNKRDYSKRIKVTHQQQSKKGTESKKMEGHAQISKSIAGESLHPSWAARKKQQEIMKQGFQGKKIVFGED